jgi:Lactoylglutathione lyase and related lyases
LVMINKVGGLLVYVSDQGQAVKFYTEKLGFDIMVNMPYKGGKWIEVAPTGSETTLSLMVPDERMMSIIEVETAKSQMGKPTGLWFYSNNIDATYEALKNRGVDITIPEKQEWGGLMSKIKDPDGNIFALFSSP